MDTAFTDRLVARWRALRAGDVLGGLLRELDRIGRTLRSAQLRNARRWPATPSPSHASGLRRLRAWLIDRVAWIDANIADIGAASGQAAAELG